MAHRQSGGVVSTFNLKGTLMKQIIAATLLAAFAVAGCSSLSDSARGPYASAGQSVSDAGVYPAAGSPFPQETDEGKF
jgi:hypothetical protein